MQAAEYFTLPPSLEVFASHFEAEALPWEWIKQIAPALENHRFEDELPSVPDGVHIEGHVYIHPTVNLPPYCTIIGPVWVGARTDIRPGAYIRGNVIIGEDCVIGNACEFKNCLLMDRVQVPHFSYVGDSVLGSGAHLGAGVVCSNLRLDQQPLVLHLEEGVYETGLKKFGAIIGEQAEVGCNSVLMPGTLLGKRSLVTPLTPFGGQLEEETFAHVRPALKRVPRRD